MLLFAPSLSAAFGQQLSLSWKKEIGFQKLAKSGEKTVYPALTKPFTNRVEGGPQRVRVGMMFINSRNSKGIAGVSGPEATHTF